MTSQRVGDWEIIDRFATGGVAEIYRARDLRTGDIVVIKRMRQDIEFNAELSAGFLREIQVSLECKHKNLIRAIAKGTVANRDYGVFEYVDGQDLARILERSRAQGVRVPPQFATFIVHEVLSGLGFAHAIQSAGRPLGLVHRDLSPRNIFVRYDGQIRVADFGASIATKIEQPEEVVGSPGYLSPEQANREPLDQRSDLFAVGCILYELIAGAPAFDVAGKKDAVILRAHQRGKIADIPDAVPENMRFCIEIACSPDREDRYRTARDFRDALFRTEYPPDLQHTPLGIATLIRKLFVDEFRSTRLPGNPLTF